MTVYEAEGEKIIVALTMDESRILGNELMACGKSITKRVAMHELRGKLHKINMRFRMEGRV